MSVPIAKLISEMIAEPAAECIARRNRSLAHERQ
jgi:hypothetical protein